MLPAGPGAIGSCVMDYSSSTADLIRIVRALFALSRLPPGPMGVVLRCYFLERDLGTSWKRLPLKSWFLSLVGLSDVGLRSG